GAGVGAVGAERAAERHAVDAWQHHVEHDHVEPGRARPLERHAPVARFDDVEARERQMHPQQLANRWIVLDDEDAARGRQSGASRARAQDRVTASVSFDFFVRSTMLPAGKYTFTEQSDQAIVAVQSADGVNFSFVLTIPESSNDSEAQPELVFDRIGSKYFLV